MRNLESEQFHHLRSFFVSQCDKLLIEVAFNIFDLQNSRRYCSFFFVLSLETRLAMVHVRLVLRRIFARISLGLSGGRCVVHSCRTFDRMRRLLCTSHQSGHKP